MTPIQFHEIIECLIFNIVLLAGIFILTAFNTAVKD